MTDFSDASINALKYAISFAEKFEARVSVLHVDPLPYMVVAHPLNLYKINKKLREDDIKKDFIKLEKRLKNLGKKDANYTTAFKEGLLYDEMEKFIKSEKIDLAIMGTSGKSVAEQLIMGSNTAEIAKKIQIPILVIPEKSSFKNIKKIAYATDYTEPDFPNVARLFFIAEKFGSALDIIHVKSENDKVLKKDNFFRKHKSDISYKNWKLVNLKDSNIILAINGYLTKEKVDLLIMSRHHRTFFNRLFHISISKKMVYNTKIPFLILNE